jgi:DNA uptake protein ComE-like DNA-binding protein
MTRSHLLIPLACTAVLVAFAPASSVAQSTTTTTHSTASGAKAARVDINTASKDELMSLPGVDGASADRIINGRPFARKHQIVKRKMVSRAVYEQIKDQIVSKHKK